MNIGSEAAMMASQIGMLRFAEAVGASSTSTVPDIRSSE